MVDRAAAALWVTLAVGCFSPPDPPTAGTPCERLCVRFVQLECVEAAPDRPGHCAAVCENAKREGIDLTCDGRAVAGTTCVSVGECE